jgi:hypothetical protein
MRIFLLQEIGGAVVNEYSGGSPKSEASVGATGRSKSSVEVEECERRRSVSGPQQIVAMLHVDVPRGTPIERHMAGRGAESHRALIHSRKFRRHRRHSVTR